MLSILIYQRAYIAASRRSDLSLPRVESARRASEIHKRRTGLSLRITEVGVINEEMYEEEDDHLSMRRRRLMAHLQTQNAEFDRRLALYLTHHVTIRSTIGQAVLECWQNNQFHSPNLPMNLVVMQILPRMMSRTPTDRRQTPYPVTDSKPMQPWQHGNSVPTGTP